MYSNTNGFLLHTRDTLTQGTHKVHINTRPAWCKPQPGSVVTPPPSQLPSANHEHHKYKHQICACAPLSSQGHVRRRSLNGHLWLRTASDCGDGWCASIQRSVVCFCRYTESFLLSLSLPLPLSLYFSHLSYQSRCNGRRGRIIGRARSRVREIVSSVLSWVKPMT